jgi:hypothetical protein
LRATGRTQAALSRSVYLSARRILLLLRLRDRRGSRLGLASELS